MVRAVIRRKSLLFQKNYGKGRYGLQTPTSEYNATRYSEDWLLYMDRCDRMGDKSPYVRLGPSTICPGRGVFAMRDIPPHKPITAYAGVHTWPKKYELRDKCTKPLRNEYVIENDDTTIDGSCSGMQWWSKYGIGHLANDALHPELTKKENNCIFGDVSLYIGRMRDYEKHKDNPKYWRKRILLVSNRFIKKGEELFVSYGIGYWFSMFQLPEAEAREKYGNDVYDWMRCHYDVKQFLKFNFHDKNLGIEDYYGITNVTEDDTKAVGKCRYNVDLSERNVCCRKSTDKYGVKIDLTFHKKKDVSTHNSTDNSTDISMDNYIDNKGLFIEAHCAHCGKEMTKGYWFV